MRIIAGTHKGRKLELIQGRDIRPTSDRTREAVFNILGPQVRDAMVLDLFAGTGALGLEALSRGAKEAVMVDVSDKSCQVIQKNALRCKEEQRCRIICSDLSSGLPEQILGTSYDLVFMDPPYLKGFIEKVVSYQQFYSMLHTESIVVMEYSIKEDPLKAIKALDICRQKKYSKTFVSFLRINSEDKHHE